MRKVKTGLALIAGLVMMSPMTVMADAADEVIAITKAQWAAEIANKGSSDVMAGVADDYTEFNSGVPVRIDGKALNNRILEAGMQASGKLILAEMLNAKVQVYGSTAILTYNFVGATKSTEGEIDNVLAMSTRVYVKGNDGWKMVHANFAPVGGDDN
jgi:ketosteroid isomerase-like protein